MIDWQTAIVALIIISAAVYIAMRGLRRIRSMNAKNGSCETGCGKCESSTATQTKKNSIVQISRLISHKKNTN